VPVAVPAPMVVSTQKDWRIMIVDDNLINLKVAGNSIVMNAVSFKMINKDAAFQGEC